ncbi:MAG: DUF2878 domain-containing protein [Desulforhopalus sp.]
MRIFVNVLSYQTIWFLSVLGGNKGALFGLAIVLLHLLLTDNRKDDLKMVGFMLFVGMLVDGTLHQIGFFSFTSGGFPLPFWLIVIWLGLAITPHHSLAWLKKHPWYSMLFGALGGPLAYWAGVRLGAASFNWPPTPSLIILAVIWGLLWPVVMHFSVTGKSPLGGNAKELTRCDVKEK